VAEAEAVKAAGVAAAVEVEEPVVSEAAEPIGAAGAAAAAAATTGQTVEAAGVVAAAGAEPAAPEMAWPVAAWEGQVSRIT
jgi:hypothetical protein